MYLCLCSSWYYQETFTKPILRPQMFHQAIYFGDEWSQYCCFCGSSQTSFSSTINWTNSYWLYINTKDSFPYQIYYSDLAQLIHLLASIYACYTRVFILCCLSINYWNQQQHTYAILLTMHCSFLKLFNNYDTKNTMVMLDLGFGCNCVEKSKGFYFCMVCCRICTVCMLILAFLDM